MARILGTVDTIVTRDGSTVPKHVIEELFKNKSLHPKHLTLFVQALDFYELTRDAEDYFFSSAEDLMGKDLEGYTLWVLESYLGIWEHLSSKVKCLVGYKEYYTEYSHMYEFEEPESGRRWFQEIKKYDRLMFVKNR